jgi:hypothetical protein
MYATLRAWSILGLTPLWVQYSGRHDSYEKELVLYTVKSAPGTIGMIQVGAEPGGSAQVIVPATALPLAAGTEPKAPVDEETDPPEPPEQAARPRAVATATEAHSARADGRRGLDVSGLGMAVTFLVTN